MARKAKKAARKSKALTLGRRRAMNEGQGASGPVTLKQAKALARASAPARVVRKTAGAATGASPATVGLERRRLALEQARERRRRTQEYKATLTIMKRRGVRGLGAPGVKGGPIPKGTAQPLKVFAEGDSWFDYPVPFFGGGIIDRLEDRIGVPILNLAKAGDEVRYMLGTEERTLIAAQLADGCPAGGQWEAMLFSGGGNDLVGNPLALWILDFARGQPPARQVNQARFDAVLAIVRAGYEDLIALRDVLSPRTHLFLHAYDYAIPDGRGICHLGPWLKPSYDLRGYTTLADRVAVTKVLLQQFAAMLQALAQQHPGVTVINTQGTLAPQASSWHNELHPSKAGFNAFAALFHQALKASFPTRVL